jgi:hypothetical protein
LKTFVIFIKPMQRLFLLLLVLLLVACDQGQSPFESVAVIEPTPTPEPTPTLAGGALPPAPQAGSGSVPSDDQPIDPDVTRETSDGRSDPALSQTAPTMTPTPGPTPQPTERLALGLAALDAGNEQLAISHYTAVLDQRQNLDLNQITDALYHLGVAYHRSGSHTSAVSTFNQLLDLDAASPPPTTYFYRAQSRQQLGEHEAALADYERYLEIHPETAAYVRPYMATAPSGPGQPGSGPPGLRGRPGSAVPLFNRDRHPAAVGRVLSGRPQL